jgi:uncharacterized PurR-regulated membrane protein YhhQ (DUF165 family)
MIGTSLSYFLVQGIAFAYLHNENAGKKAERPFALTGFIVCMIALILYSLFQVFVPKYQEKRIQEAKKRAMMTAVRIPFIN